MIDLFLAPVMSFLTWTPPSDDVVFTTFQQVQNVRQSETATIPDVETLTLRDIHERRVYRALLLLIADAEGTYPNAYGYSPYKIIFTYATFDNGYVDHPRLLQCAGDLCSDAAGMPQFLSTTWDKVRSDYDHLDWPCPESQSFCPENQELGFILYAEGAYGVWSYLTDGLQPDGTVTDEAIYNAVSAACPGWASVPCADGVGAYDQPFHSHEWMRDQFNYYLAQQPCADGCGLIDEPIVE